MLNEKLNAPLRVPSVHLNGSSRQVLLDQLIAVDRALAAACMALVDASPHGRDYYPQGAEALREAQRQHASRLSRLHEIQQEIQQIAIQLDRDDNP